MGEARGTPSEALFQEAFKHAVATLRDAAIPYAVMGSMALWARGGHPPSPQGDIDLGIREPDTLKAAEALDAAGFEIEVPTEDWLFKAHWQDPGSPSAALVDLIYGPSGIAIDDELLSRCDWLAVLALDVPVLPANELIASKVLSLTDSHCDYSSVLQFARALREQVDWERLHEQVRHSPFGEPFFLMLRSLGIHPPVEGAGVSASADGFAPERGLDPPSYPHRIELVRRFGSRPEFLQASGGGGG